MKSVIAMSLTTLLSCSVFAGTTQVGSAGGPASASAASCSYKAEGSEKFEPMSYEPKLRIHMGLPDNTLTVIQVQEPQDRQEYRFRHLYVSDEDGPIVDVAMVPNGKANDETWADIRTSQGRVQIQCRQTKTLVNKVK